MRLNYPTCILEDKPIPFITFEFMGVEVYIKCVYTLSFSSVYHSLSIPDCFLYVVLYKELENVFNLYRNLPSAIILLKKWGKLRGLMDNRISSNITDMIFVILSTHACINLKLSHNINSLSIFKSTLKFITSFINGEYLKINNGDCGVKKPDLFYNIDGNRLNLLGNLSITWGQLLFYSVESINIIKNSSLYTFTQLFSLYYNKSIIYDTSIFLLNKINLNKLEEVTNHTINTIKYGLNDRLKYIHSYIYHSHTYKNLYNTNYMSSTPTEVQSKSPSTRRGGSSQPEVTTSVPLAVEASPNYLSLKSNATPGDRGEISETIYGSRGKINVRATTTSGKEGGDEDSRKETDVTSSGKNEVTKCYGDKKHHNPTISDNKPHNSPLEVTSTDQLDTYIPLAVEAPQPEVTTTVGLADSSSNYLSVNGRATPRDRGEGSDGSFIMGMMEDGAKDVLDVTSSGKPVADLREAEGKVNKKATTVSGMKGSIVTSSGKPVADLREAEGEVNIEGHHGEWKTSGRMPSDNDRTISVGNDYPLCCIILFLSFDDSIKRDMDIGPSILDNDECIKYRNFWHGKSELRRFVDGSMHECIIWDEVKDEGNKEDKEDDSIDRLICGNSINIYILRKIILYGGLGKVLIRYYPLYNERYIMTDYRKELINVYNDLNDKLYKLETIPLKIIEMYINYNEIDDIGYKNNKNIYEIIIKLENINNNKLNKNYIKLLIILLIYKELYNKYKIKSIINNNNYNLEIYYKNFIFLLNFIFNNELLLMNNNLYNINYKINKNIINKYYINYNINKYIYNIQLLYPNYNNIIKLIKLFTYLFKLPNCNQLCELIIIYIYYHYKQFILPLNNSINIIFNRFLFLLTNYDWDNKPLIININNEHNINLNHIIKKILIYHIYGSHYHSIPTLN